MKVMRKTRISVALATALAGIGSATQVAAVNLSQDNIGDLLVFPFYTVRANPEGLPGNKWSTDFSIINSSDSTIAVKVRFHEGRNSREVLDFNVVLSPYDFINGWVEDTDQGPRVHFPETEDTCVVPVPTPLAAPGKGSVLTMKNFSYLFDDGFNEADPDRDGSVNADPNIPGRLLVQGDIDRAREGYFTVIQMGSSDPGNEDNSAFQVPFNANHDNGPNCDVVEERFSSANIVDTYNEFERNLNALKGIYALTNVVDGVQGVGGAVTMANFATWNSFIAHTPTSFMANGAAVVAAEGAVDDAEDAVEAAHGAVANDLTSCGPNADVTYGDTIDDCGASATCVATDVPYDPTNGGTYQYIGAATAGDLCDQGDVNANAVAYNSAVTGWVNARNDLFEAQIAQLSPARNLISAQDAGDGTFPPPHYWPTINSGDFTAVMLIDGEYTDDNVNHDEKSIMPPPVGDFSFDGYAHSLALYGGHYLRGVDAVTALLMKQSAFNEWANNPITGAITDFVFTAPTKSFYSDWAYTYKYEPHLDRIMPLATNILNTLDFGWPPFSKQFGDQGHACDLVGIRPWDRDEATVGNPVDTSPAFFQSFCWETNILTTGTTGSLFGSFLAEPVNIGAIEGDAEDRRNGWLRVRMDMEEVNYHPAFDLFNSTAYVIGHDGEHVVLDEPEFENGADRWIQLGMPYIGFTYKLRDFTSPDKAFGGLVDHSYIRGRAEANELGGLPWCEVFPWECIDDFEPPQFPEGELQEP